MATVRVVPSATLERWDVKQILAKRWMRPVSQMARFGDVAERRIELNRTGVRYGSVHFNGQISRRSEALSIKGATYLAHPKDVVFSKIDARNGAFGVIPDEYGLLAFTSEYPIYDVLDIGRLLPDYTRLLCRTQTFRSQVQAMVVGHSGRKRVSPELFENISIPVPPISEQSEIISAYRVRTETSKRRREDSEAVLREAIEEITNDLGLRSPDISPIRGSFVVGSHLIDRWSVFGAALAVRGISDELESSYPVQHLGSEDLAEVNYGISKSPRNRPGRNSYPYLRVANVQDGYLDLREIKYIDVQKRQLPQFQLRTGDVLLCEGNSAELVGRPALWRGEIDNCVHQNHILRVRCHRDQLISEYLLAYMQTSPSRGHFRRRAKKTTNLSTINSTDVRELSIPVPPLPEQERIADIWRNARRKADLLLASAADEERQALAEAEFRIAGG
jgi:type I restriction enzyme, S subunit